MQAHTYNVQQGCAEPGIRSSMFSRVDNVLSGFRHRRAPDWSNYAGSGVESRVVGLVEPSGKRTGCRLKSSNGSVPAILRSTPEKPFFSRLSDNNCHVDPLKAALSP